jgi:hypothetical protein
VADRVAARVVTGAYDAPSSASFDSEGAVLIFADRNAVWLSDTTTTGALSARAASQHGPDARHLGPEFSVGRSTRQLLAGGGDPYELHLVDFRDVQQPLVSQVGVQLEWSEFTWSPDDDRFLVLGGSPQLGRVLYLVDSLRPQEPTVVVNCKTGGGSEPRCPSVVAFQP